MILIDKKKLDYMKKKLRSAMRNLIPIISFIFISVGLAAGERQHVWPKGKMPDNSYD